MKRLLLIFSILLFLSGIITAGDTIIEIKGSYFSPSNEDFRDIYGGGLMFGGEITVGIYKNLSFWLGLCFFSKNGVLSFTREETNIKNTQFGGGLKYNFFSRGSINVYGGLGLDHFHSKESNVIGEATKNKLGLIGKLGINILIFKKLNVDLFLDYTYCKVKPPDFGVNIGGISTGIGLGYQF
jgi:hypothetical protein